jgi:hypothetical protein
MRTSFKAAVAAVAVALAGLAASARQAGEPSPEFSFAEPGISPDGREIAFASGGNIWSVAATGGDARLLVADGGTDRRPLFSPDGRQLAFVSTRTGGGDIYVLTLATGAIRQLVARRQVDLFRDDEPRHRGHERHLPRVDRRRHADAGEPGPIYE